MTARSAKVVITLRAPRDLKDRLDAHAQRSGISANAAALVLLADGLRKAEKEAGQR